MEHRHEDGGGGGCCETKTSSTVQTLDEVDFERGIWAAARDGDKDRVRDLLSRGTEPSVRDSASYTALHYAARGGHKEVCRVSIGMNGFSQATPPPL